MTLHAKLRAGGRASSPARVHLFALMALLVLTGCGKGKTDEKPSSPPAAATTATEAAAAPPAAAPAAEDSHTTDGEEVDQPAAQHLDFYTERYISDEERLQRRQQRIEAELSS